MKVEVIHRLNEESKMMRGLSYVWRGRKLFTAAKTEILIAPSVL